MGVKNNKFNVRSSWWNSYVSGKSKAYNTGQLGSTHPGSYGVSGGTEITPGDGYVYHFFTTAGSEETLTNNDPTKSAEYVIIGGGGAGGNGPDTGNYRAAGGGGS